jgi:hypothetical protein
MSTVLVFTGRSGVDDFDFRQQLMRVPEISTILKLAQSGLEKRGVFSKDLASFVQSETNEYLSAGLWREFVAQLVQIGLYRRYERLSFRPQFIIGDSGECSASAVCLGLVSFESLVDQFVELLEKRSQEEQSSEFLVGHRLEMAKVYEFVRGEYQVTAEGKEAWNLLEGLCKDHLIDQVITLGLSQAGASLKTEQDLGIVESVVIDPLLSWMLPYVRPGVVAAV